MKKTLERHKNKSRPHVPCSIEDIATTFEDPRILKEYGYNMEGDAEFYIDTVIAKDYAFTVFASKYVIDYIKKNIEPEFRQYLMDGTFDSLPKEYYQLLIISIEHKHDVCNKFLFVRPCVRMYFIKKYEF